MEENRLIISMLESPSEKEKYNGLKKVIIGITNGKDMRNAFQAVIKCFQSEDLRIKKMIYMYLIINSRECPDDALMVVN